MRLAWRCKGRSTVLRSSVLVCACFAGLAAGQPSFAAAPSADTAYAKHDYAAALRIWRHEADGGDAEAAGMIGLMYDLGQGVTGDPAEAVQWYRKAADGGHVPSMFNLAVMLDTGLGVAQDRREAAHWYALAAERGHGRAAYNLGVMYDEGDGVPPDAAKALDYFRMAAKAGVRTAASKLGDKSLLARADSARQQAERVTAVAELPAPPLPSAPAPAARVITPDLAPAATAARPAPAATEALNQTVHPVEPAPAPAPVPAPVLEAPPRVASVQPPAAPPAIEAAPPQAAKPTPAPERLAREMPTQGPAVEPPLADLPPLPANQAEAGKAEAGKAEAGKAEAGKADASRAVETMHAMNETTAPVVPPVASPVAPPGAPPAEPPSARPGIDSRASPDSSRPGPALAQAAPIKRGQAMMLDRRDLKSDPEALAATAAALSGIEIAASSGDPEAEYDLGYAYEFGIGVRRDLTRAYVNYLRSATDGMDPRIREAALSGASAVGVNLSPSQHDDARNLLVNGP